MGEKAPLVPCREYHRAREPNGLGKAHDTAGRGFRDRGGNTGFGIIGGHGLAHHDSRQLIGRGTAGSSRHQAPIRHPQARTEPHAVEALGGARPPGGAPGACRHGLG